VELFLASTPIFQNTHVPFQIAVNCVGFHTSYLLKVFTCRTLKVPEFGVEETEYRRKKTVSALKSVLAGPFVMLIFSHSKSHKDCCNGAALPVLISETRVIIDYKGNTHETHQKW